jgi:hypothetical protein
MENNCLTFYLIDQQIDLIGRLRLLIEGIKRHIIGIIASFQGLLCNAGDFVSIFLLS